MDDQALLLPSERCALVDLLTRAAQRVGSGAHMNLLAEVTTLTRDVLDGLRTPDALTDLPVEVLVHILSFLPFHSLVRVSATSRTLRSTILAEAVLWNSVVTSSSQSNTALGAFLERGRSASVSLDIAVDLPQSDLVDLITANIWRLSSLVISTRLPEEDFCALGVLPVAVARPAPRLRYFELRLVASLVDVTCPLFASQAPVLEHLWLSAHCRPDFSAFPALRVVVLSMVFAHSFRHLWSVLCSCPALEHFAIRACYSLEAHVITRPPPLLPALRSLRLRLYPAEEDIPASETDSLLAFLRPDVRARVDLALMPLATRNDVPLGAEVLFVGRHPDDNPRFNIHARGAGRPNRTFRGVSPANTRETVQEQLAFSADRLLELTVPAALLDLLALPDGLAFPLLHTFTVSLRQRDEPRLPLARMPSLRTLVLRREIAPANWSPDVDVDADALRNSGCPRIARLVLQGVQVEGDVQLYAEEVVRKPWQYDDQPVFERMDWWVFDDSCL